MKNQYVAVNVYGELSVHLPDPTGNWYTLCGLDGADDHASVQQRVADVPSGAKVNCRQCKAIWDVAQQYKGSDFV